jgi:hypothetical protein
MKQLLKPRAGEGYIDVAVMVLCSMMVIVLAINTFSFFAVKQDLDHYAKEMIRTASTSGKTDGAEIEARIAALAAETGLNPVIEFSAIYFNDTYRTVQLGETISVTLTVQTTFRGFGIFSVPVTLTARHSGLSQRYWKNEIYI